MTKDEMDVGLSVIDEGQAKALSLVMEQVLMPVLRPLAALLEGNARALEQLSASQSVQNDRLAALEKQIRLGTLVTAQQVRYLNDAIRKRARELLDKRDVEDRKSVTKLGNAIRKDVLARYGVGALHDIPKHEYSVAMSQVSMWNDVLAVRDVVRAAPPRPGDGPGG